MIYTEGKFEYAGWGLEQDGKDVFSINISRLPSRVSFALYLNKVVDGRWAGIPLAYFRDRNSAEEAAKILGYLIHPEAYGKED